MQRVARVTRTVTAHYEVPVEYYGDDMSEAAIASWEQNDNDDWAAILDNVVDQTVEVIFANRAEPPPTIVD